MNNSFKKAALIAGLQLLLLLPILSAAKSEPHTDGSTTQESGASAPDQEPLSSSQNSVMHHEHSFSGQTDKAGEGASTMHFDEAGGEALYEGICQGCHMQDARGAVGAGMYPALAENPTLAAKMYVAVTVIQGRKAMPGFERLLTPVQIAEVSNYVRTHFGNNYQDDLTADDVKSLTK